MRGIALGIALFFCAGILFFLTLCPGTAGSGTYTSTVHGGSTGNGVDRQAVTNSPYPSAGSPYPKGHCNHCHEQHASIEGSEPTPPLLEGAVSYALFRSNFGANKNELCYACHETFSLGGMPLGYGRCGIYQGKTKYNNSIHFSSSNMKWNNSPIVPYNDSGNCINCHNPHGYSDGAGVIPRMLIARDSKTGDSPAYEMTCEGCHNGSVPGAKNIQAELNKIYAHPTHTYNNRHNLPESGTASFGSANRHAECVDCHNPHALGSAGSIHTAGTTGNTVSDVLKNEWGVLPSWPAIWSQPTSFTERKPPTYTDGAQYEYQICFKCHSNYAGLSSSSSPVSSIVGPSGTNITNQAWEFNPNNKSAHPVVVSLNNQTGSYAPKALASNQMTSPWTNIGTQTMYCSDCHGADDEGSGGARGPHGSNAKFMLKGTGKYWATKSDGQTLWTISDLSNTNLFCNNCHVVPMITTWPWSVHALHKNGWNGFTCDLTCIVCHVVVPHGSHVSRLIAYTTDPAPYSYSGGSAQPSTTCQQPYPQTLVKGFIKASGDRNYQANTNCWSLNASVGGNVCGNYHSGGSGWDP